MSRVFGGYVYVLTNECMPGIVKIGKTNREEDRAKELFTTGVPVPFELAFQVRTLDMALLEFAAHKEFEPQRVSKNREFFKVSSKEVEKFLVDMNETITLDIFETFLPNHDIVEKYLTESDEEAALVRRLEEIRARKTA